MHSLLVEPHQLHIVGWCDNGYVVTDGGVCGSMVGNWHRLCDAMLCDLRSEIRLVIKRPRGIRGLEHDSTWTISNIDDSQVGLKLQKPKTSIPTMDYPMTSEAGCGYREQNRRQYSCKVLSWWRRPSARNKASRDASEKL